MLGRKWYQSTYLRYRTLSRVITVSHRASMRFGDGLTIGAYRLMRSSVLVVLACAEASSNLARYDGIRYGHRNNSEQQAMDRDASHLTASHLSTSALERLYMKSRSEGLGEEVLRRIITGTFVLSESAYVSIAWRHSPHSKVHLDDSMLAGVSLVGYLECMIITTKQLRYVSVCGTNSSKYLHGALLPSCVPQRRSHRLHCMRRPHRRKCSFTI